MSMDATSPLRQRMIEDMNARKLCAGTQRGHIRSCKRFAAFLQRSPETASFEELIAPPAMRHHAETPATMIADLMLADLRLSHHTLAQQLDGISLR